MANFVDSNITHAGDLAIARVLAGEQLTFTKIELGSGRMPTGSLAADMTALVSTKAVVDIVKCEPETDGTAVVGGVFVNTFTPEGFEWRELGLFADVGDGEFLFSYGNAGDFCDYIPGSGGGTVVEKVIDVFTYVGDKANVTALIRADSYATVEQYLALKAEIQAAASEADEARQAADLAATAATSAAEEANSAAASAEEGESARAAAEAARAEVEEERAAAEEDRALAELDRADEEARRRAEFEQIRINAQNIRTVLLTEDQYDAVSRTPTIEGEQGVTYYVPSEDPQENNVYVEWQYLLRSDGTEVWEMFGRGSTVPDAVTAEDIDAVCDESADDPTGTRTLTLTGVKYWMTKLRGIFARLVHQHNGSDINDGTIGLAKMDSEFQESWDSLSQPRKLSGLVPEVEGYIVGSVLVVIVAGFRSGSSGNMLTKVLQSPRQITRYAVQTIAPMDGTYSYIEAHVDGTVNVRTNSAESVYGTIAVPLATSS